MDFDKKNNLPSAVCCKCPCLWRTHCNGRPRCHLLDSCPHNASALVSKNLCSGQCWSAVWYPETNYPCYRGVRGQRFGGAAFPGCPGRGKGVHCGHHNELAGNANVFSWRDACGGCTCSGFALPRRVPQTDRLAWPGLLLHVHHGAQTCQSPCDSRGTPVQSTVVCDTYPLESLVFVLPGRRIW